MKRLIDAYAFLVEMRELYRAQNWDEMEIHFSLLDLIMNISNMPTIDASQVIWCKDCKWFEDPGCSINVKDNHNKPKKWDFCSFAEKKDES